ncbi:hypothetical protein WJX84_008422, partial [Apatococcus fuscideae]
VDRAATPSVPSEDDVSDEPSKEECSKAAEASFAASDIADAKAASHTKASKAARAPTGPLLQSSSFRLDRVSQLQAKHEEEEQEDEEPKGGAEAETDHIAIAHLAHSMVDREVLEEVRMILTPDKEKPTVDQP